MKEANTISSDGREPRLEAGFRLYELLIEPGHASAAVRVLLPDLQEPLPRHLLARAIEVLENATPLRPLAG